MYYRFLNKITHSFLHSKSTTAMFDIFYSSAWISSLLLPISIYNSRSAYSFCFIKSYKSMSVSLNISSVIPSTISKHFYWFFLKAALISFNFSLPSIDTSNGISTSALLFSNFTLSYKASSILTLNSNYGAIIPF